MDGLQWKTLLKWMIWGSPILGNTHILFDPSSAWFTLQSLPISGAGAEGFRMLSPAWSSSVRIDKAWKIQGSNWISERLEWISLTGTQVLTQKFISPLSRPVSLESNHLSQNPPMSFRWKCNISNTQYDTGILITPYHSPSLRKLMIHWISTHSGLKKTLYKLWP